MFKKAENYSSSPSIIRQLQGYKGLEKLVKILIYIKIIQSKPQFTVSLTGHFYFQIIFPGSDYCVNSDTLIITWLSFQSCKYVSYILYSDLLYNLYRLRLSHRCKLTVFQYTACSLFVQVQYWHPVPF